MRSITFTLSSLAFLFSICTAAVAAESRNSCVRAVSSGARYCDEVVSAAQCNPPASRIIEGQRVYSHNDIILAGADYNHQGPKDCLERYSTISEKDGCCVQNPHD